MLSLIQQNYQGSSSTLDHRTGGNMVLQSFDLGINGNDNVQPYPGDYIPTASSSQYYTNLDTNIYNQGIY